MAATTTMFKIYLKGTDGTPGGGGTRRINGIPGQHTLACADHKTGEQCKCIFFIINALKAGNLPKFTKVYPETLGNSYVVKSPGLTAKVKAALVKIEAAKSGVTTPEPKPAPKPAPVVSKPVVKAAETQAEAVKGALKVGSLLLDVDLDDLKKIRNEFKAQKNAAKAAALIKAPVATEPVKVEVKIDPALKIAQTHGFALDLD